MNTLTLKIDDRHKQLRFGETLTTGSKYAVEVEGGAETCGHDSALILSTALGVQVAVATLANGAGTLDLGCDAVLKLERTVPFGTAMVFNAVLHCFDDGAEQTVAIGNAVVMAAWQGEENPDTRTVVYYKGKAYTWDDLTQRQKDELVAALAGVEKAERKAADAAEASIRAAADRALGEEVDALRLVAVASMREGNGDSWHKVRLLRNVRGEWMLDVDQEPSGGDGAFDADVKAHGASVARSLAERFGEMANVRDFGAKGDNATDDAAAFEAAVAAAPAQDNIVMPNDIILASKICHVYVPAGTYRLSRRLNVGFTVAEGQISYMYNKEVVWVLAPGAKVLTTGGNDGNDFLNGPIVRPHMHQSKKEPYGTRDYACGFSVSTGDPSADKTAPVTGVSSPAQLAAYGGVDQVGLAGAAYARPPVAAIDADDAITYGYVDGVTSGDGTVTVPGAAVVPDVRKRLRTGMVVITRHEQKLVAVLKTWYASGNDLVLVMSKGWYPIDVNAGGNTVVLPAPVAAPASGAGLDVGVTTKLWGMNSIVKLTQGGYASEGMGMEASVYNQRGDSSPNLDERANRVWGFGAFAGGTPAYKSQAGFLAKSLKWIYGFVSQSCKTGFFHANTNDAGTVAFKSRTRANATVLSATVPKEGDPDWEGDERVRILASGDVELGSRTEEGNGRSMKFHVSGAEASDVALTFSGGGAGAEGSGTMEVSASLMAVGGTLAFKVGGDFYAPKASDGSIAFVKVYRVALGKNGGVGACGVVFVESGAAMPTITPPTRVGYTFGGYWTTVDPENPAYATRVKYYNADGTSAHEWDKSTDYTLWPEWAVEGEVS